VKNDGRGSEYQHQLYEYLKNIFIGTDIHYEYPVGNTGMRFDLYLPLYKLAIEYDGAQHDKFVEHFHHDVYGYLDSKKRDSEKEKFSNENGIVILRIKANEEIHDLSILREKILILLEDRSIRTDSEIKTENVLPKTSYKDVVLAKKREFYKKLKRRNS
jgi:very-short-patch-repair endonuclease